MEPVSQGIIRTGARSIERNRRAWGVFTLTVAGVGAFFAFLNGTFVGSARSAATGGSDIAWRTSLAGEVRQAVSVPEDFATIQAAIDAVADGATVLINPGVYRERIDIRGRTLHLWGVGGAASTILEGDGNDGPVARVRGGSVQFDGLTFQGGRGESGRGASVLDGAARFISCRFIDNRGGASTVAADVRFEECEFIRNRAATAGGAVEGERSAIRLDGCTVRENAAGTFGGGLSVRGGSVELDGTRLESNRVVSGAWGGGLYADGSEVRVLGGEVRGNTSAELGAGIYLFGGTATIEGTVFAGNISPKSWSVHGEGAEVRIDAMNGADMEAFGGFVLPGMERFDPLAVTTALEPAADELAAAIEIEQSIEDEPITP